MKIKTINLGKKFNDKELFNNFNIETKEDTSNKKLENTNSKAKISHKSINLINLSLVKDFGSN